MIKDQKIAALEKEVRALKDALKKVSIKYHTGPAGNYHYCGICRGEAHILGRQNSPDINHGEDCIFREEKE